MAIHYWFTKIGIVFKAKVALDQSGVNEVIEVRGMRSWGRRK